MLSYYVDGIYLYNSHLDILYSSKNGHQWTPERYDDQELSAHIRDQEFLISHYGKPVATARDSGTGSADIIRYYYPQSTTAKSAPSVIIIDIHANALTDSILHMQEMSGKSAPAFLLMDEKGDYITSVLDSSAAESDGWLDAAIASLSTPGNPDASCLKLNGTRYLKVSTTANVYGWMLVNFIPARVVFQDILSASVISLLIAIAVFALSYLMCLHFARKLNSPIENLVHISKLPKTLMFLPPERDSDDIVRRLLIAGK